MSNTRAPDTASWIAALVPAGPAPAIATSKVSAAVKVKFLVSEANLIVNTGRALYRGRLARRKQRMHSSDG
jgi:hypothetical protein